MVGGPVLPLQRGLMSGSVPHKETKILQVVRHSQKKIKWNNNTTAVAAPAVFNTVIHRGKFFA